VEGQVHAADPAAGRRERQREAGSGPAVLEPSPDGPAQRFLGIVGDRHPVVAFLLAVLFGYVLLAAASIALGLLVTNVLLDVRGVERLDERFPRWLEGQRTETWTDLSWVGSEVAGGFVIPAMIALVALAMVALHRFRIAAFLLFAVAVESATYRATTFFVDRPRPHVERLEGLDPTASYPSGHTAAAIALYCGLAVLLTSRFVRPGERIPIWLVALAIPPIAGLARMYRGMHHPIDVLAGVPIGIAAILIALFACRVAGAAAARRQAAEAR
jgi:membrane-associated phospholipid phosphatase